MVRIGIVLLAGIVAALGLAGTSAGAVGFGGRGLFGTSEIRNDDISMFPMWAEAIARSQTDDGVPQQCGLFDAGDCRVARWQEDLAALRGLERREQIERVNALMNRADYVTDARNWDVDDYWATPAEFLSRDGDCEDYAIAKYVSLKALGIPADMMRIVVLQDMNLGVGHAVLAVYTEGDVLILDNQIKDVVPSSVIHHYFPIYSLNEQHWWLHQP